jgi:hypothetical protein
MAGEHHSSAGVIGDGSRMALAVAPLLALALSAGVARAQERLCIVSTGSWASGNFPGVAGCKAGDALAALLPAQYPLMVAVGRFCDLSRPVATDRITDANDQEIGSFVCTYAGMVRPLPKSDQ